MSWRTRDALPGVDVSRAEHRSLQLRDEHVDTADLVSVPGPRARGVRRGRAGVAGEAETACHSGFDLRTNHGAEEATRPSSGVHAIYNLIRSA